MQYLFVVTYGRSGSTVLLNLLNRLEGYCIRGENNGIANHLGMSVSVLAEAQEHPHAKSHNPDAPWFGINDPKVDSWGQKLAGAFVEEILRPDPDTRVTGFKEIRFTAHETTLAAYESSIAFLTQYFPGARIIFNTRDWREVAESGWWRYESNMKRIRDLIEDADRRFEASAKALGDRAFLIDYADYKGKPDGFRPLLEWLGEEVDEALLASVSQNWLVHLQKSHDDRGKFLRLKRALSKRFAERAIKKSGETSMLS